MEGAVLSTTKTWLSTVCEFPAPSVATSFSFAVLTLSFGTLQE